MTFAIAAGLECNDSATRQRCNPWSLLPTRPPDQRTLALSKLSTEFRSQTPSILSADFADYTDFTNTR